MSLWQFSAFVDGWIKANTPSKGGGKLSPDEDDHLTRKVLSLNGH